MRGATAMSEYYCQDITFCSNRKCKNKKCERNSCHINWLVKPYHSFADFENTKHCPKGERGATAMRDKIAEIILNARMNANPLVQVGCAEADALISNGVILPPCKVGDMVYQVVYCRCGNPECYEMKHCYKKDTKRTPKVIDSIMLSQKGKRLVAPYKFEWKPIGTICYKIIQKPFKLEWLTEIGKTVFLTKEEAEKCLKEKENGI